MQSPVLTHTRMRMLIARIQRCVDEAIRRSSTEIHLFPPPQMSHYPSVPCSALAHLLAASYTPGTPGAGVARSAFVFIQLSGPSSGGPTGSPPSSVGLSAVRGPSVRPSCSTPVRPPAAAVRFARPPFAGRLRVHRPSSVPPYVPSSEPLPAARLSVLFRAARHGLRTLPINLKGRVCVCAPSPIDIAGSST